MLTSDMGAAVTGDALVRMLATLANPHRMRVVAALAEERNYVSRLARDLGISRALLQVHLRKLDIHPRGLGGRQGEPVRP